MNADGSGVTRLTNNPGLAAGVPDAPAWSPDGTRIAFVGVPSGRRPDIYVMNADGSGLRNLTNTAAQDYSPAWSPDGTRIAYEYGGSTDRGLQTLGDIYVMNADGSGVVRLADDPAPVGRPSWLR
jgi:TolB protein